MKVVRPPVLAGCAVVLLVLCGVAGASATKRPDPGSRVPYTSLELVLAGGHVRATPLGAPAAHGGIADATAALATVPAGATTPAAPAAGAAAKHALSFPQALAKLAANNEITAATASADVGAWNAARESEKQLSGTREFELGAVIGTLRGIARSGKLTPARLPALILTLQNNRQWWTSGPLLADDQRVGFAGSHLVWEFYPAQGLQIQWLGTFGAANGFWDEGDAADLGALIDQALSLAVTRGGGIAWEYDFSFDGGAPPWVSGITQGTAVEALTHAATLLDNAVYLTDANDALGIFQVAPPTGIAAATAAGARYLIYSFAPHEYVINAFIQSLIGLYDLGYQGDTLAQTLFQRGNAQARLDLPNYNTGFWSMYDQRSESNLSYHELLTDFLQTLCAQTEETTPAALRVLGTTGPAPSGGSTGSTGSTSTGGTTGPSGTTGASGTSGSSGASGTSGASGASGSSGASGVSANPNAIYCKTAAAFTKDLRQAPVIKIDPLGAARAHHVTHARFTLSKISNVTFAVLYAGKEVSAKTELLGHGTHSLAWRPPHAGLWTIALTAVDLAGNRTQRTAPVTVEAKSAG